MPRHVRNFWIELDVDGKKTRVATGPRAKDGGFTLRILQRSNGEIVEALAVEGRADGPVLTMFAGVAGSIPRQRCLLQSNTGTALSSFESSRKDNRHG